jgi:hypothetical protein
MASYNKQRYNRIGRRGISDVKKRSRQKGNGQLKK